MASFSKKLGQSPVAPINSNITSDIEKTTAASYGLIQKTTDEIFANPLAKDVGAVAIGVGGFIALADVPFSWPLIPYYAAAGISTYAGVKGLIKDSQSGAIPKVGSNPSAPSPTAPQSQSITNFISNTDSISPITGTSQSNPIYSIDPSIVLPNF